MLHPGDPLREEVDDGVRIRIQFSPVALEKQLGIGGDQAQRFLEIVRGHIGELLEFLV